MLKWDEKNRPTGYIIGLSPGWASLAEGMDRLNYMGLARKVAKAGRMGFEFGMIDVESTSEMFEPDIASQLKQVKDALKLEIGLHLEIDIDTCMADAYTWNKMQRKLIDSSKIADMAKAKFVNFHPSSHPRPDLTALTGQRTPEAKMVSWKGENLGRWIEDQGSINGINLKQWFIANFIEVMFHATGSPADANIVMYFKGKDNYQNEITKIRTIFRKAEEEVNGKLRKMVENINEFAAKQKEKAEELEKTGLEINKMDDKQKNLANELSIALSDQQTAAYDAARVAAEAAQKGQHVETKPDPAIAGKIAALKSQYDQTRNDMSRGIQKRLELEKIIQNLDAEIKTKMNEQQTYASNPEAVSDIIRKSIGKDEYEKILAVYRRVEGPYGIDMDAIFKYWIEEGANCEEYVAYHATAKWIYLTGDKMWSSIVGGGEDPDDTIQKANETGGKDDKVMQRVYKIITAVAAKYTEGHITAATPNYGVQVLDTNGVPIRDKNGNPVVQSILDYLRTRNIHIFIETEMAQKEYAGELRISQATDYIKMVKSIDPENMSYCMDNEHLISNYIDPFREAEAIKKSGDGRFIRALHINGPRPISPTHAPIYLLSSDIIQLYRYLYTLRQAGMKNAYLIWEWGSYGVQESAVALKKMREALEQDMSPKEMETKPEFFGFDQAFEAQQVTAMRLHALDPLQGFLMVPEPTHGFLGGSAVQKGKASEWQREEFR